jgi:HEAT repeat protein
MASIDLLLQAAGSPVPQLRANAIEALHEAPASLSRVVQRALADENRGVRFAATMTVGTLRLVPLAPLVEPLLHDESDSVRAAAIFALRTCGRSVSPDPLARMIMSQDPEVKANAAIVLGKLGNPSAAPMLRLAARSRSERISPARAKIVELQIAEALVKLGEEREIEAIRAALFSPSGQGEIRAFAAVILGRLRDEAYVGTLRDMAIRTGDRQEAAEVRMAATMSVARINPAAAPIEVPLEYMAHERPELRAQAALTLGAIGNAAALDPLQGLLVDENPLVQVSAAGAILEILGPGSPPRGNLRGG